MNKEQIGLIIRPLLQFCFFKLYPYNPKYVFISKKNTSKQSPLHSPNRVILTGCQSDASANVTGQYNTLHIFGPSIDLETPVKTRRIKAATAEMMMQKPVTAGDINTVANG